MEDDFLLKIALICSLTGILLLIFISNSIEIKKIEIGKLTKEDIDKDVKISGRITKIVETPGLKIFDISDKTGKITAIAFKEESSNLTENDNVFVEGKIKEYKNKLELEVDRIIT